ncbi:MAG: glycosyltransferase [Bacteroidota bacterium]
MLPLSEIIFYLFMGAAGAHLLISLINSLAVITYRPPEPQAPPPPISIIVCTRNEEKNLRELLPLLLSQNYASYEVSIVLDRCFDNSLDFLKSLEPDHPNLKTLIVDYLPDQFHPKKYGLTLAIKGAQHQWVLLTDADCRPNSDQWLTSMAAAMDDQTDAVIGYSPYLRDKGFLNAFIQYETFLTAWYYASSALLGFAYMGVGRNLAYRKSLFIASKGFNRFQGITGGDDDLFLQHHVHRKRTQVLLGSKSLVWSKPKTSWSDYFKQKKRHLSVGRFYKKPVVAKHLLRTSFHLLLWLCFIILASLKFEVITISAVLIGVLAAKALLFWGSARKMGHGYPYWITPLLDFAYALFIPAMGLVSFFRRRIKWK